MKIPVIVVDDNKTDRYMIKRRLAQAEEFELLDEVSAGDTFLEQYFTNPVKALPCNQELLILMDINMPRMSGFQAVAGVEEHIAKVDRPNSCVVMICTTSESPEDMAEAKRHGLIRGYFVKPISADDIEEIRKLYQQCLAEGQTH